VVDPAASAIGAQPSRDKNRLNPATLPHGGIITIIHTRNKCAGQRYVLPKVRIIRNNVEHLNRIGGAATQKDALGTPCCDYGISWCEIGDDTSFRFSLKLSV
jgi:hypothetical protein